VGGGLILTHAQDVSHLDEGHPETVEGRPEVVNSARVPGNGI